MKGWPASNHLSTSFPGVFLEKEDPETFLKEKGPWLRMLNHLYKVTNCLFFTRIPEKGCTTDQVSLCLKELVVTKETKILASVLFEKRSKVYFFTNSPWNSPLHAKKQQRF